MRAKLLVALLIIALGAAAVVYDQVQRPAPYAAPAERTASLPTAPPLTFTTMDGRRLALSDLREPGVILHFWASWCAPCVTEFPALLAKVAAADGRLALVAVSIDDDPAAMRAFVGRLQGRDKAASDPHVYWVWDGGKTVSLRYFDTVRVPESVLITKDRRLADKLAGDPGWDSSAMIQALASLAGR